MSARMTPYRVARRSFLRQLGGAALGLPALLRGFEARAAGLPPARRLLVIHHPVGTIRDRWLPTGGPNSLTLSPILAPFEPLRSHMTVVDGLDIVASRSGARTHEGGMVAIMTGQPTFGKIGQQDHIAGGASIDQIFLAQSPGLRGRPFPSLQLAADTRSDRDEISPRVMSYAEPPAPGKRAPLFPEMQPVTVYKRILGSMLPDGGTPEAVARIRARRASVLDLIRGDLGRLRALVPAAERSKLDAHGEAIRELEHTFDQAITVPTGRCMAPAAPKAYPDTTNEFGTNPYHAEVGQLHLALVRTAFACDLTRVATFMWAPGTNHVTFGGLFPGMKTSEHHPPSHSTAAAELKSLEMIDTWYSARTSEALQEWLKLPDPSGQGSLLDNTVVVYLSELARGYDHDFRNTPLVLFGGAGSRLPGGRLLRPSSNRPTNDMWLALSQIFEVNLTKLGASEQYTGPLPGLVV
jgi:hypothetical protein